MQSVNPVTAITTKHFVSHVFDGTKINEFSKKVAEFSYGVGTLGGVQMMTFDGSRTMN